MRLSALFRFPQREEVNTTKAEHPSGTFGLDLSLRGIPLFHNRPAPREVRVEYEQPICKCYEKCKDCPYPAHGFICWRANNECLKTDMEKIAEREKKRKNESADM